MCLQLEELSPTTSFTIGLLKAKQPLVYIQFLHLKTKKTGQDNLQHSVILSPLLREQSSYFPTG